MKRIEEQWQRRHRGRILAGGRYPVEWAEKKEERKKPEPSVDASRAEQKKQPPSRITLYLLCEWWVANSLLYYSIFHSRKMEIGYTGVYVIYVCLISMAARLSYVYYIRNVSVCVAEASKSQSLPILSSHAIVFFILSIYLSLSSSCSCRIAFGVWLFLSYQIVVVICRPCGLPPHAQQNSLCAAVIYCLNRGKQMQVRSTNGKFFFLILCIRPTHSQT